ncbi:MAG: TIGR00282 family metallophosphoesterase [Candidatus Izemoplasmatales bacterium]
MRVLFVGDVYMEKGREAFDRFYPEVKQKYRPNIVIVNGENIANGNGITEPIYKDLMTKGVHAITLGNHAFSRKEAEKVLSLPNVCRPANYGKGTIGNEYVTINYNSKKITIINMLGRVFMRDQIDSPFTKMDELLSQIDSDYIFVDFHAEATSEKYAFINYLDGRVNAVVGTHTHVPTADNQKFPKGTLYITDVGMTGVRYSIIGGEIKQGIRKFLSGVPERVLPESTGPLQFNAVLLDLEQKTIERINLVE